VNEKMMIVFYHLPEFYHLPFLHYVTKFENKKFDFI